MAQGLGPASAAGRGMLLVSAEGGEQARPGGCRGCRGPGGAGAPGVQRPWPPLARRPRGLLIDSRAQTSNFSLFPGKLARLPPHLHPGRADAGPPDSSPPPARFRGADGAARRPPAGPRLAPSRGPGPCEPGPLGSHWHQERRTGPGTGSRGPSAPVRTTACARNPGQMFFVPPDAGGSSQPSLPLCDIPLCRGAGDLG